MTDQTSPTDPTDPTESPEVADVRRLLAEARHDAPVPDDVAARMDRVLASLGDETRAASSAHVAPVLPISARRRRNAAGLLVAAAAIVVGGVTVAPHLHLPSSRGGSETASGGAAAGFDSQSHGGSTAQPRAAAGSNGATKLRGGRLVVRPAHFAADARQGLALLRRPAAHTTQGAAPCAGVPRGATSVPAEYRQAPAALVYGPAQGTARAVDLYVCGNPRPVRSTTLSGP